MAGPPLRIAATLRPLTIGEMLDRAVTFAVRSFVALALIYVVFALPITILQYFGTADSAKAFSGIMDAIVKAGHGESQRDILRTLSVAPVFNGFTIAYLVMALMVAPLATGALFFAAAKVTVGEPAPTLGAAYREGLRAWLPLMGAEFLWLVCGLAVYLAVVVAFALVAICIGLVSVVLKWVALVLAIVLVAPLVLAFLLAVLVGVLAADVSFLAVVVERMDVVAAFKSGFERVIRRSLRRSILAALTICAVNVGVALIGLFGQGVLFGILHNGALGTAFGAIVNLVAALFTALFVTAFYYDIRVRTEGYDLAADAALALAGP